LGLRANPQGAIVQIPPTQRENYILNWWNLERSEYIKLCRFGKMAEVATAGDLTTVGSQEDLGGFACSLGLGDIHKGADSISRYPEQMGS
jgi:hypothetical protein